MFNKPNIVKISAFFKMFSSNKKLLILKLASGYLFLHNLIKFEFKSNPVNFFFFNNVFRC